MSHTPPPHTPSKLPGAVLTGIGLALIVIGLVWGVIIGFTHDQLPALLTILIAGAVAAWGGQKLHQSAKRQQAIARIDARNRTTGEA